MLATATLTISPRGIITLPAKMRRALGLKADDQLIAQATDQGILLRPAITMPLEIYSSERLDEFDSAQKDLAKVMRRVAT